MARLVIDSAGNGRPNGNVRVRHVSRDNRDRNHRDNPSRDSRTNQGRGDSFGGQGRVNDANDRQLNASIQDFVPFGTLRRHDSQLPNMTHDGGRSGTLKA